MNGEIVEIEIEIIKGADCLSALRWEGNDKGIFKKGISIADREETEVRGASIGQCAVWD